MTATAEDGSTKTFTAVARIDRSGEGRDGIGIGKGDVAFCGFINNQLEQAAGGRQH